MKLSINLVYGLIYSSSSPVEEGFFFIQKKAGSLWPFHGYQALKEITIKNKYPLLLIDEAFSPVHKSRFFSKLNLQNAHQLFHICKGEKWKNTFNTALVILSNWSYLLALPTLMQFCRPLFKKKTLFRYLHYILI